MNWKCKGLWLGLLASLTAAGADTPEYGAGEMLKPARTFYVSKKGSNKNDGKTPATAWKTIEFGTKALRAGDTLLIDEGTYLTSEARINTKDGSTGYSAQCGKPGSPIRIAGMPGKNVVLTGARYMKNPSRPVEGKIYQFKLTKPPKYDVIMENPSQIELQRVPDPELVKEYPGTYSLDESGNLLVHYAAEKQDGIQVAAARSGLRIQGSWVLVENLTFTHYCEAVYLRMNKPEDKNVAEHITFRNCKFFYNFKDGITNDGATWSLFTKNVSMRNGEYGSIRMLGNGHDNLYTGNWFGPSPLTVRHSKPYVHNFALNQYGGRFGTLSRCNHIIGNVMEDQLSFRWKAQAFDARFEDNMLYGSYYAESPVRPISILRNWFGGKVGQKGLGWDLWEKDFKGTAMVFKDNVRDKKDFKPQNQIVFEAEKLRMELPKPEFPQVTFVDPQIKFIGPNSAVAAWSTPECDGFGSVIVREKGGRKPQTFKSSRQGVRHFVGITGLASDTEYEYQLVFTGRRNNNGKTEWNSFRTAKTAREPLVLEVGPGKLTLEEAALTAIPGDTVKLLPGRHTGQFIPINSGLPGKPITITGDRKAVIDGLLFYNPLIDLTGKSHYVVDGITFVRPESTTRTGIVVVADGKHITVRNCRADYLCYAGPMVRGNSRCSDIKVINNICNGGDYTIVLGGKNLTISNNTVVNSTLRAIHLWSADNAVITDNIFYRWCIPVKRHPAILLTNILGKITCDGNVHWSPVKEHPVGGTIRDANAKILKTSKTLEEWRKIIGMAENSIHADPMFADYEKNDFHLKEGSPAKGKGADL